MEASKLWSSPNLSVSPSWESSSQLPVGGTSDNAIGETPALAFVDPFGASLELRRHRFDPPRHGQSARTPPQKRKTGIRGMLAWVCEPGVRGIGLAHSSEIEQDVFARMRNKRNRGLTFVYANPMSMSRAQISRLAPAI
jgi:hypothetical protein